MDVVIPFRHSPHEDEELRYVLRSMERHFIAAGAPGTPGNKPAAEAGKVWILGDRPAWLTADRRVAEHVPHEALSKPFRFRTPVRNYFLLTFLGAVIPELSAEYVQATDDSVLLAPVNAEFLRRPRAFEDLAKATTRGRGLWRDSLWRTYDTLLRLGYPGVNYESHILHVLQRKWVWSAYRDFADFASEDPHFGLVGPTAIFNYRMKHEPFEPTWLLKEGKFIGFYQHGVTGADPGCEVPGLSRDIPVPPATQLLTEQIRALCAGKTFLNFDDASFTIAMHAFLDEEFSEPSRFEKEEASVAGWGDLDSLAIDTSDLADEWSSWAASWPEIIMRTRDQLPQILNHLQLVGEGVELGTVRGEFADSLLQNWKGKRLQCIAPWLEGEQNYSDAGYLPQSIHDQNCLAAFDRLSKHGNRCQVRRLDSSTAVALFVDASLDFVYVDASYSGANLKEDLRIWAPKIRPGGLLCGNNYLDGVLPSGRFEVKSTVDAWAEASGLEIKTSGEPDWRSWFIRLPLVESRGS
ncbi:class I SAM-dependent methyltransferase [Anatilimnocola floriformis]|uniref:class I SAM-dependent methyltransferase n=1 Tax=Anatilimnocola floriformis TaxID=2948575 RepID=UPI0020C2A203|nr:class I SAM-dependent methyltransferase [Anatilimnocola floriformis]